MQSLDLRPEAQDLCICDPAQHRAAEQQRRHAGRIPMIAAAAIIGIVASGCSAEDSGDASSTSEQIVGVPPGSTQSGDPTYDATTSSERPGAEAPDSNQAADPLLDQFVLLPEQDALIFETVQILVSKCMVEKGFEYEPVIYDPRVYAQTQTPVTEEDIRRYGYSPIPVPPGPVSPNVARMTDEPGYRDTLSQCDTPAYDRVYPPDGRHAAVSRILEIAESDVIRYTLESREHTDLVSEWATCMRNLGFDYSYPDEPVGEFSGAPMSPLQIETRRADVGCRHEISFEQRVRAIENRFAEEWIEANPTVAQEALEARDELLRAVGDLRASL